MQQCHASGATTAARRSRLAPARLNAVRYFSKKRNSLGSDRVGGRNLAVVRPSLVIKIRLSSDRQLIDTKVRPSGVVKTNFGLRRPTLFFQCCNTSWTRSAGQACWRAAYCVRTAYSGAQRPHVCSRGISLVSAISFCLAKL